MKRPEQLERARVLRFLRARRRFYKGDDFGAMVAELDAVIAALTNGEHLPTFQRSKLRRALTGGGS